MPTGEQLYLRALRILDDGLPHSPAALEWAARQAGRLSDETLIPREQPAGFTLRELSLGAGV